MTFVSDEIFIDEKVTQLIEQIDETLNNTMIEEQTKDLIDDLIHLERKKGELDVQAENQWEHDHALEQSERQEQLNDSYIERVIEGLLQQKEDEIRKEYQEKEEKNEEEVLTEEEMEEELEEKEFMSSKEDQETEEMEHALQETEEMEQE